MDHTSQGRILPDARFAVLFLHGIVGTPRHFSHVLPLVQAVPQDWSYYNLLLPGHGGTVSDFAKSSMKQWKQAVWDTFSMLAQTHEAVVVVGHSMGTLFAIQLAIQFPQKIPFIFLLASPIRPRVRLSGITCCLRTVFNCPRKDRPAEMAISLAGGTKLTRKLWCYIPWAPHMMALLREADRTRKLLPRLKTKTIVFQSHRDEMVSHASGRILQKSEFVELTTLRDSTHFYYPPEDGQRICKAFAAQCNGLCIEKNI